MVMMTINLVVVVTVAVVVVSRDVLAVAVANVPAVVMVVRVDAIVRLVNTCNYSWQKDVLSLSSPKIANYDVITAI